MPPRTAVAPRTWAAIIATAVIVTACGSDDEATPATTAAPQISTAAATDPADTGPVELAGGITISGVELRDLRSDTTRCRVLVARASVGDHRLHLAFNGESCAENGEMEALNGNYGDYLSPADVYEESLVSEVTVVDHPLGTLSSFDHEYVECTNDCTTDVSPMAILELDEPVMVDGVTYPTIVLRGDSMTTGELLDVAATLTR